MGAPLSRNSADATAALNEAIGLPGLAVIDVGDDCKITDMLHEALKSVALQL